MGKMIELKADKTIKAYLANPKSEIKGGIIVIHEVWGLVDHIKQVADRYAEAGLVALAPSLLEFPEFNSDQIAEMQKDLFNPATRNEVQPVLRKMMAPMQEPDFGKLTVERLKACFDYLYEMPETNHKIVVTGFCFGGSYSFSLATVEPKLTMAIVFYGHADQPTSELKRIKCPVKAFFGENDERLISQLPDLARRMKEAGVDFESTVYPNCGHAFFNDSNPYAYNQKAARDAWVKVQKYLGLEL
jgi:carboxymethylenebutenolidase